MSGNTTVLVNRGIIRNLLTQNIVFNTNPLDTIFSSGAARLDRIAKLSGCKCKHGSKKNKVYDDTLIQLRQLSFLDIAPLKTHLNATTLNLGHGYLM